MLAQFSHWLVYSLLQIAPETAFGAAAEFFFYDTIKILLLIFVVIFLISFLQTFLPLNKLRNVLVKQKFGIGYFAASALGAVSPFCSCSSLPLFMGFLRARVPLGIAFAFLITSPLVNEIAFVMMGGLFGWKIAFAYAITGILLGVFAGLIIDSLKLEKEVLIKEFTAASDLTAKQMPKDFSAKVEYALVTSKSTFRSLWLIVVVGIAIGAVLHGYVPADFFSATIGKYESFSVPLAVLLGIPIYAGCSTVVPLIFSITAGGVPLGTALAFMMAVAGLSLPEGVILKRIISLKLLMIFFGLVAIGIIFIGYLFNIIS